MEAHVYEAYWAPLTEGRVKAFHVTRFLLEAGMRGLRYGVKGRFDRWVGGGQREYPITRGSVLLLTLVFAVVLGVLALFGTLAYVAILRVLGFLAGPMLNDAATGLAALLGVRLLHSPLLLVAVASVAFWVFQVCGIAGALAARPFHGRTGKRVQVVITVGGVVALGFLYRGPLWNALAPLLALPAGWSWPVGLAAAAVAAASLVACWGFARRRENGIKAPTGGRLAVVAVIGAVVLTVAVLVSGWVLASGAYLVRDLVSWLRPATRPATTALPVSNAFFLVFLAAAWYGCHWLRALYIQYMGDVAVYLSSHTLNEFAELRTQIRKIGYDTGCAIYGAHEPGPGGKRVFQYDEVLVVGHSLGSVVAYDTLNAVLNEDQALGGRLQAERRTRLFATFGSPLDKSAFIFRTQKEGASFREQLSAAVQPLMEPLDRNGAAKKREIPWVNLHSPFDPISGSVNYYDLPGQAPAPDDGTAVTLRAGRVVNLRDPGAVNFGHAHVTYWANPLLAALLHEAVTTPRLVRSPVQLGS